ncbi:MAG: sensor histidine kinase [Sulfurimonas sp. CG08_land_8_20_14_0_20_36_33]|nr:MAG: two-component sensor histidine kinase [Sulfurimonas sp. CG23_combo_of_CG06-09_8_20_14_all_36_33]PIS25837.1 MAG: sensor histidine kinase [Sulfurimonas sp. CG08_land_8_20_14_0_20_36_33]PIU35722.1 MAG: sensor histidine kinase [Sulfurimonas sp. CG07_land_8_20_14_0_80_36_56]PIV05328.1 MAG: sensor histidine kinase [Sulfurimonas sp. CG03_land_8_20_14_0_80_36_25]PIV35765.1 MAG: sensor histidine kinase [Sulfurimonas sp. CG02_land_8_20_14_3_00_36_67]PIV60267.1 MAG: sensor histidine kinase [Sulfu
MDISMNKLTKKSFYSFLTLYLLSSFTLLLSSSYWFYSAQISTQENTNYYRMNHIADVVSADVIYAHMMGKEFTLKEFPHAKVGLYDAEHRLKFGTEIKEVDFSREFYIQGESSILISQATHSHLNINFVVVESKEYLQTLSKIKQEILYVTLFIALLIMLISVFLSYIFLQPIKEKMLEIENFVKDTTHELKTPITALMMSTSRAKSKKEYDEKIIQNISISTKQLYDIYSSLTYLSFDHKSEEAQRLAFEDVIQSSIEYFDELLERKNISLLVDTKECFVTMAPTKAKMLFNNLLSNAIKYSLPNKRVWITTTENSFTIRDEGIGIAPEKLDTVFKRFTRANNYAGGFGVGLSIVESIAKEYGFKVEIESQENEGTTITIRFHS